MQGEKSSALTIHEISKAVDEGKILLETKIIFPPKITSLAATYAYISQKENKLFKKFLNLEYFETHEQNSEPDFYWPKLNTEVHGFIDWNWKAYEIVRFCNAFDIPFKGASTFFANKRVRLINASVDDEDIVFHPFQNGIIYRKKNYSIWVAASQGGVRIDKISGIAFEKLKLGKRFVTPIDILEKAKLS